jgi:cell wall-associated NlpC family hydrolase
MYGASCVHGDMHLAPVVALLAMTATPALAAPNRLGDPAQAGAISKVIVVASVGDAVASDKPAYARADQKVTLYAAIQVDGKTWFSEAPSLEVGGKRVVPKSLASAPAFELRWNKIEPATANMTNGDAQTFRFEPIDYRPTAIEGAANSAQIRADVRPTLTPDHGDGVGTMRYQVTALQGPRTIASAGPEARRGRGSGGVTDAVMRVSIRRDDTYLGYLTEMFGQPYIWGSAGLSNSTHESERLEGSDCADFIVYGARRMGAAIPYSWTGALPGVSKLLAKGTRAGDGIYRDGKGKPLPFTKVGDLVLFPRHVGALAEDRGTIGVLDDQDIMMHTLFDSPKAQPIADSGYADRPVEVRRFTADLRRGRSGS